MHNATHFTLWEECFPQPRWAALGASILPCSVPPLSLNPSYPSGIEVRGVEEIGKRVVISVHNKRLVNEIFFKVVHNGPLKGEELSLA